jgi:hypothetical protein
MFGIVVQSNINKMTDELTSIIENSSGIRKTFVEISLRKFITLLKNKEVIIAEWNRDEVTKRPGDSHKLLASIAYGWNIGTLLGYWNGILPASKIPSFTAENPLQITEGGHRSRWILEIADNVANIQGNTLPRIQTLNPELYEKIMEYKIRIDVTTHTSGIVPLTYIKGEYKAINTFGEILTIGENLRAATDNNFNQLKEALDGAFYNRDAKMKKLSRDKSTELLAGCIQIVRTLLSKDGGEMKPKEILAEPDPTDEIMDDAIDVINELANLEDWLKETYGKTKDLKTIIQEAPKLEFFGPILYGISKTPMEDRKDTIEKIKQFYELSMVSKETWETNSNRVKCKEKGKGGNGGNRLNRKRYEVGWNQLLSIITPPSSSVAEDGIRVNRGVTIED